MNRRKLTYREAIERNAYLAFQMDIARRALSNCIPAMNDVLGKSHPLSQRLFNVWKNAEDVYSDTEDEMYDVLKQQPQFRSGLRTGRTDASDVFYGDETRMALVGRVVNHSEEWDEFRAYALKRAGMSESETETDERR